MTTLVTIGEFARLTHLSVKTLRHYHESGVLAPSEIDPASGYRRYDVTQLPAAYLIRRLRDLDMPLADVRAVLETHQPDARNRIIGAHLDRMEHELERTRVAVDSLRALLAEPASPVNVVYRHAEETPSLAVRDHVSRGEIDEWCAAVFPELYGVVANIGLEPTGPGGALYQRAWFEDDEGEVLAFVPVDTPAVDAMPRIESFTVPAAWLAVAVHAGSFRDLDRTYGALGACVADLRIGGDGPIREHYLVSPADASDAAAWRTEVCWPITPKQGVAV